MYFRNKRQNIKVSQGFTLIELLVVIAIIGLLASIALVSLASARQKSRNARRLADMAQMNTALGLYFNSLVGYPSSTTGIPSVLIPAFAASLPVAPQPGDGTCPTTDYNTLNASIPANTFGNTYYYYPSGTAYKANDNVTTVYPDYAYYFCLGNQTGNWPAGVHLLTPTGVK